MSPRLKPGQAPKRPGRRPTVGADGHLHLRVPAESMRRWRAAARAAGTTLSEWVRRILDGA